MSPEADIGWQEQVPRFDAKPQPVWGRGEARQASLQFWQQGRSVTVVSHWRELVCSITPSASAGGLSPHRRARFGPWTTYPYVVSSSNALHASKQCVELALFLVRCRKTFGARLDRAAADQGSSRTPVDPRKAWKAPSSDSQRTQN